MIDVAICIVLYSRSPKNSDTLQSISSIDFASIGVRPSFYIRDNSIEGFDLEGFKEIVRSPVVVSHDSANMPLSYVYNRFVEQCSDADLSIIFDDDSVVTKEYFSQFGDFLSSNASVAVPTIFDGSLMISPGTTSGIKGKSLAFSSLNIGAENHLPLVAMMSGVVIKRFVFDLWGVRFDERLNLYGIDTKFFQDVLSHGGHIFVFDFKLAHDSCLRKHGQRYDSSQMFRRLDNLIKAHFIIFETVPFYRFRLFFYLPLLIISRILKFRDFRLIKLFLNYRSFLEKNEKNVDASSKW